MIKKALVVLLSSFSLVFGQGILVNPPGYVPVAGVADGLGSGVSNSILTNAATSAASLYTLISSNGVRVSSNGVEVGLVTNINLGSNLTYVVSGGGLTINASSGSDSSGGTGNVFVESNNVFQSATPIDFTNANAAIRWIGAGYTNLLYMTATNLTFTSSGTNYYLP